MKKLIILGLLLASFNLNAAQVQWDSNTEPNLAGYKVYLVQGSNTNVVTLGNITTHNLTNLINGVNYDIYVTAFNTAGLESVPSNAVNFTPAQGIPPSPIVTTNFLSRSGNIWSFDISWNVVPNQFAVNGYWVSVKQAGNSYTNLFTTNLSISFSVPVKNNTQIFLQASNYFGLSSATPIATYTQPGQIKNVILTLP